MSNIEQLQKLLIEEIIDKGYIKEEFEQFVQQQVPEKDDLTQWIYDDLFTCIKAFQKEKQQQNYNSKDVEQLGFQVIDQEVYDQIISNQHKIYIDNIAINPYEKIVKCQQEKYYVEKNVELQFYINHPQEVRDQGLWSFITQKQNVIFQIQTFPMQWKVQRTLQDFQSLRTILSNSFPEKIFPKFNYGNLYKMEEMIPQMQEIILSIKSLLQTFNKKPMIRTLQSCLWFINEGNEQLFHKKLNEELKKPKKYKLEEKQTVSGEIFLKLNFEGYKIFQEQQSYPRNAINLLNQAIINLQEFKLAQQQSQNHLIKCGQYLTDLEKSLPNTQEQLIIVDLFNLLNEYFNQINYEIQDTYTLIENHIKSTLIKFQQSHNSYLRLCENVKEIRNQFVIEYNNLNKKKDDIVKNVEFKSQLCKQLSQKNQDKVEIDNAINNPEFCKSLILTSETQQIISLQDQFVYMMQEYTKSMNEQFKSDSQKIIANLGGFLYAKEKLCQKYVEQWKILVTNYELLKNKLH